MTCVDSRRWTQVVSAVCVGSVLANVPVLTNAAQQKTTKSGVFSVAQAKRGEGVYKQQCASCHAADLTGGDAPALAGADFLGFWDKTPVSDLVTKIRESMPQDKPGSLTAQQSADVTAFMFRINRFPAGSADLPSAVPAQKAITIAK